MASEGEVSFGQAIAIGLGAIIGAGIFVLSGTAIALAGSLSLFAFIVIGILSLLISMQLGELSTIFPHAKGTTYSYAYEAFGHELGFLTGIMVYFSFATSIGAIADGFGAYITSVLGISKGFSIIFSVILIIILTILNILGIQKAAEADFYLVIIKLSVLSVFIISAIILSLRIFSFSHFESKPSQIGVVPFFSSGISIFFAYTGFQVITSFADKVKGGVNKAAKAVILSVVISIIFYVLVALSMLFLVPASKFVINADPLSFALSYVHAPSWLYYLIDAGGMIATTSASLAMILLSGRTLYQIGKDMNFPSFLIKYDQNKDVAPNAIIISSAIAIVSLFSGSVFVVASISNFGLLFSFLISSLAIFHFRRKGIIGSYKTPFYPWSVIVTIILLISLLIGFPKEALIINLGVMLSIIIISYILKDIREEKSKYK
ncbi:APC family permease [Acidianus manzaensis]|uniref:Amino acid permease n=1 Tax=Acidianus manzaensis TaxID=282676 RepID=A0A1W6JYI6_9CREN|nr:APC family permease [Acidianus manzaensis]ARM75264.1 amino acid permease [Acidianus manzaensis]